MYQALLFDMDGVLLDTEEQAYEIWRDYLKRTQNFRLPRALYARISGAPPEEFDCFIRRYLPGNPEELLREWGEKTWERIRRGEIRKIHGYDTLMDYLKRYPGKKAIVTSNGSTWMRGYLELFRFEETFDAVFTADLAIPRKPSPEPYLHACRALGVLPAACLAVEDSQSGITAALRAGIPVAHLLGISGVTEEMDACCVAQLRDLEELTRWLREKDGREKKDF